MRQLLQEVAEQTGKNEEFNHRFFHRVKDMVKADDQDAILREKIPIKLLRLTAAAQNGFVLTDFPNTVSQAELLEEYKGGMNAFVHLTLPDEILVDIEESKIKCSDCGHTYYKNDIIDEASGIRIDKHMPENNTCDDCGGQNFVVGSDPTEFEKQLVSYKTQKDELLTFYNHFGLLVDFEVRHGYGDYEKIKRNIQFNLKH
jgi:adenylate kinase family enzyme